VVSEVAAVNAKVDAPAVETKVVVDEVPPVAEAKVDATSPALSLKR